MSLSLSAKNSRIMNRGMSHAANQRLDPSFYPLTSALEDLSPKGVRVSLLPGIKDFLPTIGVNFPAIGKSYLDSNILGVDNLTDLDPSNPIHAEGLELLMGIFYHESWGHGKNTKKFDDLSARDFNGDYKLPATSKARNMAILFEEFRIEHRVINKLPHAQKSLERLSSVYILGFPSVRFSSAAERKKWGLDQGGLDLIGLLVLGLGRCVGGTIATQLIVDQLKGYISNEVLKLDSTIDSFKLIEDCEVVFEKVINIKNGKWSKMLDCAQEFWDIIEATLPESETGEGGGSGGHGGSGGGFSQAFPPDEDEEGFTDQVKDLLKDLKDEAEKQEEEGSEEGEDEGEGGAGNGANDPTGGPGGGRGKKGVNKTKRVGNVSCFYVATNDRPNAEDVENKDQIRSIIRTLRVTEKSLGFSSSTTPPGSLQSSKAMAIDSYRSRGMLPPEEIKPFRVQNMVTGFAPKVRLSIIVDSSGSMTEQLPKLYRSIWSLDTALKLEDNDVLVTAFSSGAMVVSEPDIVNTSIEQYDTRDPYGHHAGDACEIIDDRKLMVNPRDGVVCAVLFFSDLEIVDYDQDIKMNSYINKWKSDNVIIGAYSFTEFEKDNLFKMDVSHQGTTMQSIQSFTTDFVTEAQRKASRGFS